MAEIRLEHISKSFGKVKATDDIHLVIQDQEFMVLLGPSGCGKTTLLRCIAGLEKVDSGRVFIGNKDVTDLPPRKRRLAMVFQSYAVFPHLNIFENIAFGLRMQHAGDAEVKRLVHEAAEMLQITDLLERYPAQISGGQRQRVAVARAIAVQPEVLLMDEPLSNLDALLRLQMRAELKRLVKEIRTTVVYVTHDQVEALSLGDRIAVMLKGSILQMDAPIRVYEYPVNTFVGGFIGTPPMNFLKGEIVANGRAPKIRVAGAVYALPEEVEDRARPLGREGWQPLMGIRAENIETSREALPDSIHGTVMISEPLGSQLLVTVRVGDQLIKVTAANDLHFEPDEDIWLKVKEDRIRWMNGTTGEALFS
jgi:multiple sugar transport system ATP-binding protein